MDQQEANDLLVKNLSPYKNWPYDKLKTLVDKEIVTELTGESGVKYFFEIYVAPVNENEDALLVEGSISKVNGRRWFPEYEDAEFGITPDNFIYYQSKILEDFF